MRSDWRNAHTPENGPPRASAGVTWNRRVATAHRRSPNRSRRRGHFQEAGARRHGLRGQSRVLRPRVRRRQPDGPDARGDRGAAAAATEMWGSGSMTSASCSSLRGRSRRSRTLDADELVFVSDTHAPFPLAYLDLAGPDEAGIGWTRRARSGSPWARGRPARSCATATMGCASRTCSESARRCPASSISTFPAFVRYPRPGVCRDAGPAHDSPLVSFHTGRALSCTSHDQAAHNPTGRTGDLGHVSGFGPLARSRWSQQSLRGSR